MIPVYGDFPPKKIHLLTYAQYARKTTSISISYHHFDCPAFVYERTADSTRSIPARKPTGRRANVRPIPTYS